jgi:hypothetical protein
VNPTLHTLEVYRHGIDTWTLLETYEGDMIIRAEPFSAIDLPLNALWAR